MHVITWKDLSVDIYRADDPTTKKSMIVRVFNFILPVNFLLVVEVDVEVSTVFSTVSENVADEIETLDDKPLFGMERN